MSDILAREVAALTDISCVRSNITKHDIEDMAEVAMKYNFICAHVLPSNVEYLKSLLNYNNSVKIGSPVGFPSGGTLTSIKKQEMKELVKLGCDEIDVVLNIGWLRSGMYDEAKKELIQVMEAAEGIPTKIILETALLNEQEIKIGAKIALEVGAEFVKTGTGWIAGSPTIECINIIKETVNGAIGIKASGGIRDLASLVTLYNAGVTRFGVGYKPAVDIINECLKCDKEIKLDNYKTIKKA